MDSITIQYIAFIVAALILIWAVIEINRRYFSRRDMDTRTRNTWVRLDANQPEASEEEHPATTSDDTTDGGEQDTLQTRARQNGHYSESKRAF